MSESDLRAMIDAGTFREDLLYRLNVVNLRLPPLRERPGDVVAMAEFFIKKYAAANGAPAEPEGGLDVVMPTSLAKRAVGNRKAEFEEERKAAIAVEHNANDRWINSDGKDENDDEGLSLSNGDRVSSLTYSLALGT